MSKRSRDEDKELIKSLYKYMLKNYGKTASNRTRHSDESQTIVEDILDDNFDAEVDPDKIPAKKPGVLRKAKGEEKERRKQMGYEAKEAHRKKHEKTGTLPNGKKFSYPGDPKRGMHFGINHAKNPDKPGESVVGNHIRTKSNPVIPLKQQREDNIRNLKGAPKINFPKDENGVSKAENAKLPKKQKKMELPNKPRVKGVKRLKGYLKKHDNGNL